MPTTYCSTWACPGTVGGSCAGKAHRDSKRQAESPRLGTPEVLPHHGILGLFMDIDPVTGSAIGIYIVGYDDLTLVPRLETA